LVSISPRKVSFLTSLISDFSLIFVVVVEGISAAKEMAEAEQLKNVSFHQVDMVGEELADEGKNLVRSISTLISPRVPFR